MNFLFGGGQTKIWAGGVGQGGRKGGRGEEGRGRTNERPKTDHVISVPMRGLEKNCNQWHKHTATHPDIATL